MGILGITGFIISLSITILEISDVSIYWF